MSIIKALGGLATGLNNINEPIRKLAHLLYIHDNKAIFIANGLMICIWIAGIIGMIIMYVTIETRYKADPKSCSNLFKIIY